MSQTVRLGSEMFPPGKRIDVGGYKLHLWCMGLESLPTVVLEAVMANFSLAWSLVQPAAAKFGRVCTYDRAGLGWSDPSPKPRTIETIIAELHTLLTNGDVPKPYILVGHSMGGIYMAQYASHYPADVAGLILVDSAHPQQNLRLPAERQKVLSTVKASSVATFQRYAEMNDEDIVRDILSKRSDDNPRPYSQEVESLIIDRMRASIFQTMAAEILAGDAFLSQSSSRLVSLGDLPLEVLTAGARIHYPGVSDEIHQLGEQIWLDLQRELASTSSNGTHHIIEDSSHDMLMEKPDIVADSIIRMIERFN